MSAKRLILPEQALLLKVAEYFERGHFCQGEFNRYGPKGQMQRCPLSAIDMFGKTNPERRAAKRLLAMHLANIDSAYRVSFACGKIDAEETIVEWVDAYSMKPAEAAAMMRWAATGVLPENHNHTAIATQEA